jgi:flagellar assembly protein FliH
MTMASVIRTPLIESEPKRLAAPGPDQPQLINADSISDVGESNIVVAKNVTEKVAVKATHSKPADIDSNNHSLIAELQDELQTLRASVKSEYEKAQETGYQNGRKHGLEDVTRDTEQQLSRLKLLIANLTAACTPANFEDVLVEIAYSAICRILGDTLITTDGVTAAIRKSMEYVTSHSKVVIRVSAEDYQLLYADQDVLMRLVDANSLPTIVADKQVLLGGCIVEHEGGSLDSRLELQMQLLRDILINTRKQRIASNQSLTDDA